MFNTNGIDLLKVAGDARVHGNDKFADVIYTAIENLQTIYNVISQKQSATGKDLWQIDGEYVKTLLK